MVYIAGMPMECRIGSNTNGAFPSYPITGMAQTVIVKLVAISTYGCKPDSMEMTFNTVPGVTARFYKRQGKGAVGLTGYIHQHIESDKRRRVLLELWQWR